MKIKTFKIKTFDSIVLITAISLVCYILFGFRVEDPQLEYKVLQHDSIKTVRIVATDDQADDLLLASNSGILCYTDTFLLKAAAPAGTGCRLLSVEKVNREGTLSFRAFCCIIFGILLITFLLIGMTNASDGMYD